MSDAGKIILEGEKMALTIKRLCYMLLENHGDFKESCILGLQRTGVPLMGRILAELKVIAPELNIIHGKLDVTFYRDDHRRGKPLQAHPTEVDFLLEDKRVILIDDVLFTGRTIRAAMDAILHFGRPKQVELLSLIDRRFTRDLPIQADFVGITIDTPDESYVRVDWGETSADDKVYLFPQRS